MRNQTPIQVKEERDIQRSMDTQFDALSEEDQTRVAALAYGLYEQRGRKDGHDLEDWFNAERQAMAQGRPCKLEW